MTGEKLGLGDLAKVVNEAERAYGFVVGNFSVPSWDFAEPVYRDRAGRYLQQMLRCSANVALTAQQAHEIWSDMTQKEGWIWGITHDEVLQTDPRLRPWADLAPTEQVTFDMTASIVGAFKRVGLAPEET